MNIAPRPAAPARRRLVVAQAVASADAPRAARDRFGRGQLRALGRALQEARQAHGWSLKRLAAASRVSVGAIQRIEAGEASASLLTVAALAEALGTTTDRLVRASLAASQATRVVHAKIPERLKEALDITGSLDAPRMRAHIVALAPRTSRQIDTSRSGGALFAYVIRGRLRMSAADGALDDLGAGDVIHWSVPGQMKWFNPQAIPMLALCIVDQRRDPDTVEPGGF